MRVEPVRSPRGSGGGGGPRRGGPPRRGPGSVADRRLDRRPRSNPAGRGPTGIDAPAATSARPSRTRTIELSGPFDLARTLGGLRYGAGDPCVRLDGRHLWRATRTPDGAATVHVHHAAPSRVEVEAWGPGAGWAVEHAPELIGEADDLEAFEDVLARTDSPAAPMVRRLHRSFPGLRLPRTSAIGEAVAPVVLGQRVTSGSARRSWRQLVWAAGEPAPTIPGARRQLRLPPSPAALASLPEFTWHRLGVEARRAGTIRRAASRAARLDEAVALGSAVAQQRLASLVGIGPWTIAEVVRPALGDPDVVTVGDYHLPHHLAWALRGEPRGDDAGMLDALAPFAGQRGRVCQLIVLGTPGAPKFAARKPEFDISLI